jgi:hypothetical protein
LWYYKVMHSAFCFSSCDPRSSKQYRIVVKNPQNIPNIAKISYSLTINKHK